MKDRLFFLFMIKAYKYKLNPTKAQAEFFERSFSCARYIYNWGLDLRIKAYQNEKQRLSYVDLAKMLTLHKKDEGFEWLSEVTNESLQQSLRCMDSAFTNFFRNKKGFPKFKSKHRNRASYKAIHRVTINFENNRIKLPKIGWVKFYANREFEGKIGTATVSKTPTGKYYVSVLVDNGIELPIKAKIKEETAIGIDVGLKDFATLSNGERIDNPKYLQKNEKRLAVLQRRLSRKTKGSNRRNRARLQVAKMHERITNLRTNFLHQISSKIVSENQTIIIEDLNVEGMLKNHCLAKAISSVSWSEFFRQLEYKCEWYGKNLIRIGRFEPSSKMCSCGVINKDLKLSDRKWTCKECGTTHDRDLLASQNIKRFGLDKQNLIGQTPTVSGEEDVELPTLVGAVKRQYKLV